MDYLLINAIFKSPSMKQAGRFLRNAAPNKRLHINHFFDQENSSAIGYQNRVVRPP